MDVAFALGCIKNEHGKLVPLALETRMASTLYHERSLRRGWDDFRKRVDPKMDRETIAFTRLSCAIAVRELAGQRYTRSEFADYAWIVGVRREAFEAAVMLVKSWLDDLCITGIHALKERMQNAA